MPAKALGLICALVLSAPAFADSAFYAGGSVGQSRAAFGPEFGSMAATTVDDKQTSSFALKLFGGYEMTRNWALEGGFARLGAPTVRTHDNATGAELKREFRASSLNMAVKAALTPTDAFSLFGKLGLTRNFVKVYSSPEGTAEPTYNRTGAMYGAGIGYAWSKNVSLRAEYEHFGTFGRDFRMDPAAPGSLSLVLWSVGLAYSFR